MGVKPAQVADLLALKGDAVDNIPGAPGIGDKGARDLIQRFGSVEGALDHAAEVERKTYRESLQNNREQILLSKRLATIDTSVPIEFAVEIWRRSEPDIAELKKVYKELEFYSLLKELGPAEDAPPRDYAALDTRRGSRCVRRRAGRSSIRPRRLRSPSNLGGRRSAAHDAGRVVQAGVARALSIGLSRGAEADPRGSAAAPRSRTTSSR